MTGVAPKLPAEIIHLIIDILAEQSSGEPGTRMDVLHTCSRVSWLFHLHAQKHRFSHIYFRFDNNARKRAKRLLQVLVPPRNHYLHPFISSVTFLIHPSVPRTGFWSRNMEKIPQKVKTSIRAVGKKLRRELDWIACTMIFLEALDTLQEMTLASYSSRKIINWPETVCSMPELSKILWLAMHPGLRHLAFRNLRHLPVLYILARNKPPPGLRKLTIDNTHFHVFSAEPYADLPASLARMLQERLATVEELKWISRGSTPPVDFWPSQLLALTPTYSSLTTIVFHLSPRDSATNQFFQLLLSASRTLQSLELHNVHTFGPELNNLASDYLGNFTALRHVGYKAKATNMEYLRTQLVLFSKILLSARVPLPVLSSISVNILEYCLPDIMSDDLSMLMLCDISQSYVPVTGRWSALDNALCNPNFVNLRSVHFNVKLFVKTNGFRYRFQGDQLRAFVPQVYDHPLADIRVAVKSIEDEEAYESWMFETDN